ncbi:hypothetical protein T484DRAFT_1978470 [Baffinella frigidus]|nr:hypothetical protein T484DRAFT_1978470 [Cryptophyta sp. CCMP2293]
MWHLAMAPRALLLTRAAAPTFLHCYVLSALPACEGAVTNQGAATRQRQRLPHTTYSVRCYVWAQAITLGWALASTSAQGGRHDTSPGCIPSLPLKTDKQPSNP